MQLDHKICEDAAQATSLSVGESYLYLNVLASAAERFEGLHSFFSTGFYARDDLSSAVSNGIWPCSPEIFCLNTNLNSNKEPEIRGD